MKNYQDVHKIIYRVIKTNSKYGVEGVCDNETVTVKNLTADFDKITDFVKVLNAEGLELCHLKEVAEDFLYDSLKQLSTGL